MVGDLKNGRTVHSLVRLLSLYQVSLNFVSPESLTMPASVTAGAIKAGVPVTETTSLASVIGQTDVLYVTRVQQERFTSEEEYARVKDAYVVNNELLGRAKPHCIVMHPLPRNSELDPEVDVRYSYRLSFILHADFLFFLATLVRCSSGSILPANAFRPLHQDGSSCFSYRSVEHLASLSFHA